MLEHGDTVTADEDNVRRSIANPRGQIVVGYDACMPTFPLTDDEVDSLVVYVRSLG